MNEITLKDIAEKSGVSITTVYKALNNHPDISEKRKEQIIETAIQMKYVPNIIASNLRKKTTKFIGLIVSDNTNPYYAKVIKGVEEVLASCNYKTIIFNTDESIEKEISFVNELVSIRVAGVIITPAKGNIESTKILKEFKIPYVLANRYIDKDKDNYVIVDDLKAGYIAAEYLIKNRYKKIIFINSFEQISSARNRYLGCINALKDNNISPKNCKQYQRILDQSDGYNITKNKILLENKPPFSIICYSDYIASGVIRCLLELNVEIPNEISVMGIDNTAILSFSHPGISTVSIPKLEIGKRSAEMLYNLIRNENVKKNRIILEPKLVIRESA